MATVKEILAENEKVNKELKAAGVAVSPYKKSPDGKDVFSLGVSADNKRLIRVWKGLADVKVYSDPSRKQAVLEVSEPERSITNRVRTTIWSDEKEHQERRLRSAFPVYVPGEPVFTFADVVVEEKAAKSDRKISAIVTVVTPETKTFFLVGQDEHSQFICGLPEPVKSVKKAHEVLKPKGLRKGYKRQGEFFFNPATAEQKVLVEKEMKKGGWSRGVNYNDLDSDNESSGHMALVLWTKKSYFAIGAIIDSNGRHKTLLLNDWHEVVRNLEIIPEGMNNDRWD